MCVQLPSDHILFKPTRLRVYACAVEYVINIVDSRPLPTCSNIFFIVCLVFGGQAAYCSYNNIMLGPSGKRPENL